jgi:hypothetical protein
MIKINKRATVLWYFDDETTTALALAGSFINFCTICNEFLDDFHLSVALCRKFCWQIGDID